MTPRLPTILRSIGSALNIAPAPRPPSTALAERLRAIRPRSDADALAGDWRKVESDLRDAMGKAGL
jgi:hypothetical protein